MAKKTPKQKRAMTVREMAAMGGKARAKGLSKTKRSEIASNAAKARWADQAASASSKSETEGS